MAAAKKGGGSGAARQLQVPELSTLEYTIAEKEWTADENVSACEVCRAAFSNTNRKHHCRVCGRVVCQPCSSKSLRLPAPWNAAHAQGGGDGVQSCRVCDTCSGTITKYRAWRDSAAATLLCQNLPFIADFQEFGVYDHSAPTPYGAPVWVSGSAQLLCWHTRAGAVTAVDLSTLDSVVDGLHSADQKQRLITTSCGCLKSENAELKARAPRCFSLVFADGACLDVELKSAQQAKAWSERFRALLSAVVPLARVHSQRGHCPVQLLERKESARVRDLQTRLQGERIAAKKGKSGAAGARDQIAAKYSKRPGGSGSGNYQKLDDD